MGRIKTLGHPVQSKIPVEMLASAIISYMREGNDFNQRSMADFVRWCIDAKADKLLTRQQAAKFLYQLGIDSPEVMVALVPEEDY